MHRATVQLVHPDARLPVRATEGSVGYDLCSCEAAEILPGERRLVDTGVRIALTSVASAESTASIYARVAPRSGLAVRGIDVAAGVCDADYRGTYRVLLVNNSKGTFAVAPGDRIAQLLFEVIVHPEYVILAQDGDLGATDRGDGGFGSTGV
jgi:dUTP pyrophosphatase